VHEHATLVTDDDWGRVILSLVVRGVQNHAVHPLPDAGEMVIAHVRTDPWKSAPAKRSSGDNDNDTFVSGDLDASIHRLEG